MTTISDDSIQQVPIPFGDHESFGFGVWSCRFSADGNEVVAGGSEHIFGKRLRNSFSSLTYLLLQFMI